MYVSIVLESVRGGVALQQTIDSIRQQTLAEFEVFIVSNRNLIEKELNSESLHDPRVAIINALPNCPDGLNVALSRASGDAVLFCNDDDIFIFDTLERLYASLKNNKADISIGFFDDARCGVSSLVDWSLSQGGSHDFFDPGIIRFGLFPNRLYSRSLIVEHGLKLEDSTPYALCRFNAECALLAQGIVGSDCFASRKKRCPHNFDVVPTNEQFSGRLEALVGNMQAVVDLSKKVFSEKTAYFEQAGEKVELSKVCSSEFFFCHSLYAAEYEELLRSFYRKMWLLDGDTFKQTVNEMRRVWLLLTQAEKTRILEENDDIDFDTLASPELLSRSPLVSVLIDPVLGQDAVNRFLSTLFLQSFHRFEVIVSENSIDSSSVFCRLLNLSIISVDAEAECDWKKIASYASGSFVVLVADESYWLGDSLRYAWRELRNSRADFISGMLVPFDDTQGVFRSSLFLFDDRHRTYAKDSRFNCLDSTLGNKLIRRDAFDYERVFCGSKHNISKNMYQSLSFVKTQSYVVLSTLSESDTFQKASVHVKYPFLITYYLTKMISNKVFEKSYKKKMQIKEVFYRKSKERRPIKNQVLFISDRGNGELTPNLKAVYDSLSCDKVVLTHYRPYPEWYRRQLRKELLRSRVIVTDDYINELTERPFFRFSDKQSVIQLWHACGAFKKFGLDCFGVSRLREGQLHDQYKAVMVSSEEVREIYAGAFGISSEKVIALGTPRTDSLLNTEHNNVVSQHVLDDHPELEGKTVILYCPTFRQKLERQAVWNPEIDWASLSEWLGEDKYFLVKRHPIDKTVVAPNGYPNIICVDNDNTNDLLRITDVLVTDYSSVIFDAALLDIPMLFYCPDFDTFERDFYLNFPEDLPGEVCFDSSSLIDGIKKALKTSVGDNYQRFKTRYLSSCDGKAAKRVADYIQQLIN